MAKDYTYFRKKLLDCFPEKYRAEIDAGCQMITGKCAIAPHHPTKGFSEDLTLDVALRLTRAGGDISKLV